MPTVNVLVKPASGRCNLRCKYCFYSDETKHRETACYGMMSEETLEQIVKKALEYATGSCSFGFQGGEPTLAGLAFFEKAIALERQYNTKEVTIYNAIQTNGTCIDDEWADFFAKNDFLVGISLDGGETLHDLYRRDMADRGTFASVMKAIGCLKRAGVKFNILTVVTAQTARHIDEVYAFFKRCDLRYQQYIPCLDPIGEERGKQKYSLTPERYGKFLIRLFSLWYADRIGEKSIYIRYFENLLQLLCGRCPEGCGISGICSPQHAFEADGSVFPCDFYMLDAYRLGNIHQDDFPIFQQRREALRFIEESVPLPSKCHACRYVQLCRGGCKRDRVDELGRTAENYYCAAYRMFFDQALPGLYALQNRTSSPNSASILRKS